ncbi:UbiX family flavin prenyltransferase [Consotaella salsifontis]|uniref:Flavin prenyltransferase UbiX n=1 Tax=Consotaella salsifontis TaxID=1365950 RepID=A0A1T4TEM8_9HYPH|nr:UbiX family flavin prenyltransferase [Consotaella salsifontis]SKA38771.1 4-hydroxy-3-polyprenylbenzoate decarboxylase [Consotaella salsifontis]
MSDVRKKRLVVGITGASGSILALDLLRQLKRLPEWESHVVVSAGGLLTMRHEVPGRDAELSELADVLYRDDDLGAAIASGSFPVDGMVVVPCSMKSVAGIHSGYAENLLLRAADVAIKERRTLVLVARETPLSAIHLRNLSELANLGVVVLPPVMTFYNAPQGPEEMVRHITGKILDLFGETAEGYRRWGPAPAR